MLTMGVEAIQQDFQSTFNSFGSEFITGADNWTVSAFVQDTYQITETLALIGGIRFDHREWDVVSLSPFSPAVDEDRHADVWSPKLGATWEMIENTTAWLTLSRSYRLPTGFDIGAAGSGGNALFFANPTIDPVDARTIEIGTRCHRSVMLSGSVAWFYSDVRDDILFNPFNFQNENFDSTRQGVELTLNSKPVKWVNLYATAAYVDTEFDGGAFDGNQLPLVAEWQFTGGITLEPITGLFLTLEAIHARDQIRNNDLRNDFDSNDYTVVNARASYRWKFMTMFVNVNNLLDKLYETFPTVSTGPGGAQAAAYNPAAGINFQAGASFTF
jgi:iron complex outermembrane receptor protein